MQFEPVWISSSAHLAQFDEIIANTPWWRRGLGFYNFPPAFPRLDMGRRVWGRPVMAPLCMFSQGQLIIKGDTLSYHALDVPALVVGRVTVARHNLRTDWHWELRAADMVSVESAPWSAPMFRYYDMPFARIRTDHRDASLRDFVVCVGGTGYKMDGIRQQSARLLAELQRLKSA